MSTLTLATQNKVEKLHHVLEFYAKSKPQDEVFIFIDDGNGQQSITFAELCQKAKSVAQEIQSKNIDTNEPVVLLYPPGIDFIIAIMGCFFAGAIAVPSPLPMSDRSSDRVVSIIESTGSSTILCTQKIVDRFNDSKHGADIFSKVKNFIASDKIINSGEKLREIEQPIAFLQYTSGSTSAPKGVIVSHKNIMENQAMIKSGFGYSEAHTVVCWLPIFHDMGLIGNVFTSIFNGMKNVFFSPANFIRKPVTWLKIVSDFKATSTGGPNFALDLCTSKISDEELADIDLSSLKILYNGSEPIKYSSMKRFAERFFPFGFRESMYLPCYGLAEATLFVSGLTNKSLPTYLAVDVDALERGEVSYTGNGSYKRRVLVGCGPTLYGNQKVTIVNPETGQERLANQIGEICIAGGHITEGYWKNEEATANTFIHLAESNQTKRKYLKTGDLGFIDENGELFITGRIKEIIILNGQNIYPYDIETTAERAHEAVELHASALFSVNIQDEQKLILVSEIKRTFIRSVDLDAVSNAIRKAVYARNNIAISDVVLVKPLSVPKTTSGKIQRLLCRKLYESGSLSKVQQPNRTKKQTLAKPSVNAETSVIDFLRQTIMKSVKTITSLDNDVSLGALGLDSLEAHNLASVIEKKFHIQLDIDNNFANKSINDIANIIEMKDSNSNVEPENTNTTDNTQLNKVLDALKNLPHHCTVEAQNKSRELMIEGRKIIDFASCNYLGLDTHPKVIASVEATIEKWGTHPSWTRAVASPKLYIDLEEKLSNLMGVKDVVVFPNLAMTSQAVLAELSDHNTKLFLCQSVHKTVTEAANLAKSRGAEIIRFRYMDFDDLTKKLAASKTHEKKLICIDGVYSMTTGFSDIVSLHKIAKTYNAILYVDDAHGFGIIGESPSEENPYGLHGNGIVNYFGMETDDPYIIYAAGMSKAYSSHCAFVTCPSKEIKKKLRSSSPFVFSGPVPNATLATAIAGLKVSETEGIEIRKNLYRLTTTLVSSLVAEGFEVHNCNFFPVVTVITGKLESTVKALESIWEAGILVTPAIYPAVPMDSGGLRMSLTNTNTLSQIEYCVDVFKKLKQKI